MFVDKKLMQLVFNKKRKYEFANAACFNGFYRIENKVFELVNLGTIYFPNDEDIELDKRYNFYEKGELCGSIKIDEDSAKYLNENKQFRSKCANGTCIDAYEWCELDLKELKGI